MKVVLCAHVKHLRCNAHPKWKHIRGSNARICDAATTRRHDKAARERDDRGVIELPDGTYDALVVDARIDAEDGIAHLDIVITSGERKGDVVTVRAAGFGTDESALLAAPATLHVRDGQPNVSLDT